LRLRRPQQLPRAGVALPMSELRNRLNEVIADRRPEIRRLLASYGVPVL
jgi:hypothetical protein